MKISEMIKNLQSFMEEHGDLDCWYAIDDEGNGYQEIQYEPSLYCVANYNGEVYTMEDVGWMELEHDDYKEICVVN